MNKIVVIGVIALFVGVFIIPSINANIDSSPVKSKLVETTVRIHRSNGITPFTLKLTEKESYRVDRIFDNLKVSLDSAETDEEIDEIFDNAVESLYELGMFPKMNVEEAKQLVNSKSQNSGGKSPSGNLGTGDENFNCQIAGGTTYTYMWDLSNSFGNKILEFIRSFGFMGTWFAYNFRYYDGKIGNISLGSIEWDAGTYYHPAKGWILTNGSHGVVGWIGELYGNIEKWMIDYDPRFGWELWGYIGIRDFEGLWIKRLFGQVNLLGNAGHVSLSYTPD